MTRGGSKIQKSDLGEYDRVHSNMPVWLEQFANSYDPTKTAVEVARERNQPTVYERMNSILGGTTACPYSSVEEAIGDYHKRTGLSAYLNIAKESDLKVVAQSILEADDGGVKKKPEFLDKNPAIENYINNLVDTQYGIQLPAVIQSVLETFPRHVSEPDLDDKDIAKYIAELISSKKRPHDVHELNIGRGVGTDRNNGYNMIDQNRDPFAGLMPSRVY